jgi:hypothetical protein
MAKAAPENPPPMIAMRGIVDFMISSAASVPRPHKKKALVNRISTARI